MGTDSEQAWLEAALDRYEAALLRYAASVVGRAAAPDVVQDTFLALCRLANGRAEREQLADRLAPWLFTVCRNRAVDALRQGRRLEPLEDEDMRSPESEPWRRVEAQQSLERVQELVDALPDKQRQAVILKFSGGLSYKEIAEVQLSQSLEAKDRVSIVTYAGNSGLVLAPTPGSQRDRILQAIDGLEPGGSTNGASGIRLAYSLARKHFVKGNVNRVLLATDGDFNVGVTSQSELVELVQREAKSGVFLSVLGFGDGNYQDSMLEKLADKGNGNYAYIDEPAEAQKVLVEQATGTLLTLAKDVKLQLEFNPAEVAAYRLIGYENRKLGHQDFNDDTKDAGELGADHSVTALYEVIPAGKPVPGASADPLKYQAPAATAPAAPLQTSAFQGELLSIKLRYQPPAGGASQLIERTVRGPAQSLDDDFRFAAAVAEFGMLLRNSPHRGKAAYDQVLKLAQSSLGDGKDRPAREQFVELVRAARRLAKPSGGAPQRPTDDYDFGL